jgi:hypothetical protein
MRIINIDITKMFPKNTIYCGRNYKLWKKNNQKGNPLYGNPFKTGAWTSREDVILAHYYYTKFKILSESYKEQINNMKNHNLACHCKPLSCHCDNYRLLENNDNKNIYANICNFIVFLMNQNTDWKQTSFSSILKKIATILINNKSINKKHNEWETTKNINLEPSQELINNISIFCDEIYKNKTESYLFIDAFCSLKD